MLLARVDGDLMPPFGSAEGVCPGCDAPVVAVVSPASGARQWAHLESAACPHIAGEGASWRERWAAMAPEAARGCRVFGSSPSLLSPGGFAVELVDASEGDVWPLVSTPAFVGRRACIVDARGRFKRPPFAIREGWDSKTHRAPVGVVDVPAEPLLATAPLPTVLDYGSSHTFVLRVDKAATDTATAFAINRRWLAEHVALVMHGAAEAHGCIASRDWDGRMPDDYSPQHGAQKPAKSVSVTRVSLRSGLTPKPCSGLGDPQRH